MYIGRQIATYNLLTHFIGQWAILHREMHTLCYIYVHYTIYLAITFRIVYIFFFSSKLGTSRFYSDIIKYDIFLMFYISTMLLNFSVEHTFLESSPVYFEHRVFRYQPLHQYIDSKK